ncbi:hypothetical protein LIER_40625 [Lithospermum erythrorhizon]|uniref:Uncharacterized protein n=1 Tax=Lithospermum erythrorhizon TaxID=34254 RepID=A0AAV3R0I5_LITER
MPLLRERPLQRVYPCARGKPYLLPEFGLLVFGSLIPWRGFDGRVISGLILGSGSVVVAFPLASNKSPWVAVRFESMVKVRPQTLLCIS